MTSAAPMSFKYSSGEEAKDGDCIKYPGKTDEVEFCVSGPTGYPARDWYLEQFPGGGMMIVADRFGSAFVKTGEDDEDLGLISRGDAR